MRNPSPTVAMSFVQNMLGGARRQLSPCAVEAYVAQAGIAPALLGERGARVTREQFVLLYRTLALGMGDEMLGLWSRPIRAGTLKYLGLSLLDASSVLVAMYRFTRFWNLLLDDYGLELRRQDRCVTIFLKPRDAQATATFFGHELMVKLSHGIASWLVGRELPLQGVGFGFSRPAHFSEYAQLFPGPVNFDQTSTWVSFAEPLLHTRFRRSREELLSFVRRAPDDWIFVAFDAGPVGSRVRLNLSTNGVPNASLGEVAAALAMSSRSLSRRLAEEGSSFQRLKDDARRDLSIERLVKTDAAIDRIAMQAGFDSTPAFHRAFRGWTGSTPSAYRRQADATASASLMPSTAADRMPPA